MDLELKMAFSFGEVGWEMEEGEILELDRVGRRWTLFRMKTFKDIIDLRPGISPSLLDLSSDFVDLFFEPPALELS